MNRPNYLAGIRSSILASGRGSAFVSSDFRAIAPPAVIKTALPRLEEEGLLRRVMRGVYEYPEYSTFLGERVAPDPHKIAQAIARNFGWTVVPCGITALNLLGLSTQVPASWSYVSSGPYRTYAVNSVKLVFKHTADKEIAQISPKSALVIQAVKSLGRDGAEDAIPKLQKILTKAEKAALIKETQYATAWVFEAAQKISQ